jgi:hypothetical protein
LAGLRAHYGIIGDSPRLVGGYSGSLSNTGERIRLESPDESPPDDPANTPYVTVDEVIYDDQGSWPTATIGDPIVRRSSTYFGNDGSHWIHASAFAELVNMPGDFDGDGHVDGTDIDLLIDAVARDSQNSDYVLSGANPTPESEEIDYFVEEFLGTFFGDANLDHAVDAQDLNTVGVNWLGPGCGGWQDGDFNGNGVVDASDLNRLGSNWLRINPAAAARTPRAALSYKAVDRPATKIVNPRTSVGQSARDALFDRFDAQDGRTDNFTLSRGRQVHSDLVASRKTGPSRSGKTTPKVAAESIDQFFAGLLDVS